ncbi:Uncharacterised protein [Staphylococcus argenteus]|nr:Uncharacterised protein [Staphylococcus argenteus]
MSLPGSDPSPVIFLLPDSVSLTFGASGAVVSKFPSWFFLLFISSIKAGTSGILVGLSSSFFIFSKSSFISSPF